MDNSDLISRYDLIIKLETRRPQNAVEFDKATEFEKGFYTGIGVAINLLQNAPEAAAPKKSEWELLNEKYR